MAEVRSIKVPVEAESGKWPRPFYCPCALTCHRNASPCGFSCMMHDYDALQWIVRGEERERASDRGSTNAP